LAWVSVACAGAAAASTTPPSEPSLASTIAASMEGVQLEVVGGGAAAPGGSTVLFVHHGGRAAEVYWTTDGWCLSRVYTWKVEHATSSTSFELAYDVDHQYTDCVMAGVDHQVLAVSAAHHMLGQTSYDGVYTSGSGDAVVRTQCTSIWDYPSPCGFSAAAAMVPDL
jgi:hypothetical protein